MRILRKPLLRLAVVNSWCLFRSTAVSQTGTPHCVTAGELRGKKKALTGERLYHTRSCERVCDTRSSCRATETATQEIPPGQRLALSFVMSSFLMCHHPKHHTQLSLRGNLVGQAGES